MDARDAIIQRLTLEADRLDEQAAAALVAGNPVTAADIYERALIRREAARLLTTDQHGKKRTMHAAERLRVSKGNAEKPDAFRTAVNAAGFTVRSLAQKLRLEGFRVSHAFLRQCLDGDASIREPLAKRIEALTGFRATRANWPKGWAREPKE